MMPKLIRLLFLVMTFLIALAAINASGDSFKIVLASEILDNISNNKPVEYYNAKIIGDLDFSKLNPPPQIIEREPLKVYSRGLTQNARLITSRIHIEHSSIDGIVSFNNTIFEKPVVFNDIVFNGYADFKGSQFNDTASFYGSTFNSTADFKASKYCSIASFKRSRFSKNADFGLSEFNGEAKFAEAEFDGPADFGGSKFERYANYTKSQFIEDAIFGGSRFNKSATFIESQFNGLADFGGSQFAGYASFGRSHFSDIAKFAGSKFNGSAGFQDSYFNNIAAFEKSEFNGTTSFDSCRFNGDALFEDAVFNGLLSLNKTKYDKFYVAWSNIFKLAYDKTAYLLLIENFKKIGFLTDADDCYLQYRMEQRNHPRPIKCLQDQIDESFSALMNIFFEKSFGYGVRPLNPLAWSVILVLAFSIFWGIIGFGAPLDDYTSKRKCATFVWNSIILSAAIFLSGTKLFIDPPSIPKSPWLTRSFIKAIFIFERSLGALFSILFFLAISGTILRL